MSDAQYALRTAKPAGRQRPRAAAVTPVEHGGAARSPVALGEKALPIGSAPTDILALQRAIGNWRVQRLLDRPPAGPAASDSRPPELTTPPANRLAAAPPRSGPSTLVQRTLSGATVGQRVVRNQADNQGQQGEVLSITRIEGTGQDRVFFLRSAVQPNAAEYGVFGNNPKYDVSDKETAKANLGAYPVVNLVDHGAPGTGHQGAVFKLLDNLAGLDYQGQIHLTYERSKTKLFAEKFGFTDHFKRAGAPANAPQKTWDLHHGEWDGMYNNRLRIRCHPVGNEIFPEKKYDNLMQKLGCTREVFWTQYAWPGAPGLAANPNPPLTAMDSRKAWLTGTQSLTKSQETFYKAIVEAGLAGRQVDRGAFTPLLGSSLYGATVGQRVVRKESDNQGPAGEVLEVTRTEGNGQERVIYLRSTTQANAKEYGIFSNNPKYAVKKEPILTMFGAFDAPGRGGDMYTGDFGATSWLQAVRTMTGEQDPVAVILQPFLWGEGIQVRQGDAPATDVKQAIVESGAVPSFKWTAPPEPADADLGTHVAEKYRQRFGNDSPVDPARIADILARGKSKAIHLITVYYTASSGEVDYAQVVKVLNKAVRAADLSDGKPVLIALLGDEQRNAREVALQQNPDLTGVGLAAGPDPMQIGAVSLAYIGLTPVMPLFERYSELVVTEGANTWQEVLTIGTPALTTRTAETRPFDPRMASAAEGHDQAGTMIEGASNALINVGKKGQVAADDPDLQPLVTYIKAVRDGSPALQAFAQAWKSALTKPESDQVIQALKRLPTPP